MTIVPFKTPLAPKIEPTARLIFGTVEIELNLTYIHHLNSCAGWGDQNSEYAAEDCEMARAMKLLEQTMWSSIRPLKPFEQCEHTTTNVSEGMGTDIETCLDCGYWNVGSRANGWHHP